MEDIKVCLRNLRTREWTRYTTGEWLDRYYDFVEEVLCAHRDTLGGSFGLTGTPEKGRITVCDVDGKVIRDYDWRTVTSAAAASQLI